MRLHPRFIAAALLTAGLAAPLLSAQTAATPAHSADPWWKHALFYEIYPRSFQDSDGDGTGDINGITQRLDKLQTLGVDAIWIAPAYPSPQVDFGYDISDYQNIDPQYGTLADFDKMLAAAKAKNIRIIMDAVLNHTSDKHAWFIESASSKTNPKADWYVWSDGKIGPDGKHMPPNNWDSEFGGSGWEWVPARQQYYYHKFYKEQPDLNWRNPVVEKAIFDMLRFWLDRGVAGFRLDAIDTLLEDTSNTDEDVRKDANGKPMMNPKGEPVLMQNKTSNLPENHAIIKRMRQVIDSYPGDRVLIGETYLPNVQELYKWYGGDAMDELQLPMDTQVGVTNGLNADIWRSKLKDAETSLGSGQPLLVIDNHDNPRMDRYCKVNSGKSGGGNPISAKADSGSVPEADCLEIQKMLTTVLMTSRAAALMYYGDEIAMKTTEPTRVEDVKDPVGRRYWPMFKGRDGERTPMQWTPGKDAGFSTADQTWLPIPADYKTFNFDTESAEKRSMLDWYEKLIALRRDNPVLRDGTQNVEDVGNANILAWSRDLNGKSILVATNFSGTPQEVMSMAQHRGKKVTVLASSFHVPMEHFSVPEKLTIPAYGAIVVEVE